MIAKRIDREPENDNFRNLANYIRDADAIHARLAECSKNKQRGKEKVLHTWFAGCIADDYALAIKEVEVTQALNTRVTTGKTYHLMLSFRPEDEAQLTEEVFCEIELEFAKALGFEEHQRHCGVHKNTDNMHIHIAYNMIHPDKLTKHEPFHDFNTLSQACRAIEQKYGLVVDRGMEEAKSHERTSTSQRAKAMEAHSGQESFTTYAQRHSAEWLDAAEQAQSWADFHCALAAYGVEYSLRGNGAVFVAKSDAKVNTACKASAVARELSKTALCKKFGEFTVAPDLPTYKENMAYSRQPLSADVLARQQYKEAIKERRDALASIQREKEGSLKNLRQMGVKARDAAKSFPIARQDRGRLAGSFALTDQQKREEINLKAEKAAAQIKEKIPFANWSQFVQHYEQHAKEPLSPTELPMWKEFQEGLSQRMDYFELVYQRRKNDLEQVDKLAEKARQEAATVALSRRDRGRLLTSFREIEQRKRQEIIKKSNEAKVQITEKVPFSNWNQFLQWKAEQGNEDALSMLRKMSMQQFVTTIFESEEQENVTPLFAKAKVAITKQGTVVIRLESGEVRDTGDTVFFRGTGTDIAKAAALFAQHKWGKEVKLESGTNFIRNVPEVVRKMEKQEAEAIKEHEKTGGLGL